VCAVASVKKPRSRASLEHDDVEEQLQCCEMAVVLRCRADIAGVHDADAGVGPSTGISSSRMPRLLDGVLRS
jgi:hypothetical protein